MTMHESQVDYWNDPAVAADVRAGTTGVSDFAENIEALLTPNSNVVELGCGAGDDAIYFAQQGHMVTAFDVSQPLIDIAYQRYANVETLEFRQADITQRLDVGGNSTDLVYARFSLHYFSDDTTNGVINEVNWVLRPGGRFAFTVKSTDDPLFGKGTQLEPDMFEYRGEIRHFFSRSYASEMMIESGFIDISITEGTKKIYGEPSAFLTVMGQKR